MGVSRECDGIDGASLRGGAAAHGVAGAVGGRIENGTIPVRCINLLSRSPSIGSKHGVHGLRPGNRLWPRWPSRYR